jgi:hypothetical protein
VRINCHARPGPLRSPETDIGKEHGCSLELARSAGGEYFRLVEVDFDRDPASTREVVAQFRKEFGDVDADPHLLASLSCLASKRRLDVLKGRRSLE